MKKLSLFLGSLGLLGVIIVGLNQAPIFAEDVEPEVVEECEGPHEKAYQRLGELGLKEMFQQGRLENRQEGQGLGPQVRMMARQHRTSQE